MRRFFLHFIIPGVIFYIINVVLLITLYPKSTDPYLYKLTADFKGGIIVGSSRASQGLNPDYLGGHYINYSFSNLESSFTSDYIDAIIEKFESSRSTKKSLIIEVNPWNLSDSENIKKRGSLFKRRNSYPIFKTFEYLYFKYSPKDLLRNIIMPDTRLKTHKNGWLEVKLDEDEISSNLRSKKKLETYVVIAGQSKLSDVKLRNLVNLITYADQNNIPYLIVRLPVSQGFKSLEKKYCPKFDEIIRGILKDTSSYIAISDSEFMFTDGHHLRKESANKISKNLSKILSNEGINKQYYLRNIQEGE